MTDQEEFKILENHPNYAISTFGNVEHLNTARILKLSMTKCGYYYVNIKNKNGKHEFCTIHRLVALNFLENPENKSCVDHIDNNRLNNRIDNLRFATHQENGMNQKLSSNNKSGIKGVYFDKLKKKWIAQIMINRKMKYLGTFNTKDEAKTARQEYAIDAFGEYINDCENFDVT